MGEMPDYRPLDFGIYLFEFAGTFGFSIPLGNFHELIRIECEKSQFSIGIRAKFEVAVGDKALTAPVT